MYVTPPGRAKAPLLPEPSQGQGRFNDNFLQNRYSTQLKML